jgi:hypothetical protein
VIDPTTGLRLAAGTYQLRLFRNDLFTTRIAFTTLTVR